jgi:hypothetical protein
MHRSIRFTAIIFVCLISGRMHCEEPTKSGVIEGHAICADNRLPAKLAKVLLIAIDSKKISAEAGQLPGATTDMDGAFRIEDVPSGDYFIYALLPGYVDASINRNANKVESSTGDNDTSIHVSGTRTTEANLILYRGATMTGKVTYADGSPAPGAKVSLLQRLSVQDKPQSVPSISPYLFDDVGRVTDDQGRFRLAGIAPGEYSIQATLSSPKSLRYTKGFQSVEDSGNQFTLVVFLGNTLHWKQAAIIRLDANEEIGDVNVEIPLQTLHTVSGTVHSLFDQHVISTGVVTLTSIEDPSFTRKTRAEGGRFEFDLLPTGKYSIEVANAKDVRVQTTQLGGQQLNLADTVRRFKQYKSTIDVQNQDLTDLGVTLTPE